MSLCMISSIINYCHHSVCWAELLNDDLMTFQGNFIYSTKTYMWCLCLDDPSCLTIYMLWDVYHWLQIHILFSALYYGARRLQTTFSKSTANWSTMGFLKKMRHSKQKKDNLCFCFSEFHFRIQKLATHSYSRSALAVQ